MCFTNQADCVGSLAALITDYFFILIAHSVPQCCGMCITQYVDKYLGNGLLYNNEIALPITYHLICQLEKAHTYIIRFLLSCGNVT